MPSLFSTVPRSRGSCCAALKPLYRIAKTFTRHSHHRGFPCKPKSRSPSYRAREKKCDERVVTNPKLITHAHGTSFTAPMSKEPGQQTIPSTQVPDPSLLSHHGLWMSPKSVHISRPLPKRYALSFIRATEEDGGRVLGGRWFVFWFRVGLILVLRTFMAIFGTRAEKSESRCRVGEIVMGAGKQESICPVRNGPLGFCRLYAERTAERLE